MNSNQWVRYLDAVAKSMNHAQSKGLFNHSPHEIVFDLSVCKKVSRLFALDYMQHQRKYGKRPDLQPNALVRHVVKPTVFTRGFQPRYSEKIYRIKKVIQSAPPQFVLEGKRTKFYRDELSLVRSFKDQLLDRRVFIIERQRLLDGRVSRSGKRSNQQKQFLVKSIVDRDFSKWLPEAEVKKLQQDGRILRDNTIVGV